MDFITDEFIFALSGKMQGQSYTDIWGRYMGQGNT